MGADAIRPFVASTRAEIQLPGCGHLIVLPPQFLTFAALRKVETE